MVRRKPALLSLNGPPEIYSQIPSHFDEGAANTYKPARSIAKTLYNGNFYFRLLALRAGTPAYFQ